MSFNKDYILELERITEALENNNIEGLKMILDEYHPSEIAEFLDVLPADARGRIIHLLPVDIASEAISEMDPESHPERLLETLTTELAGDIVEELSDDDAADLLNELPADRREQILDELDHEDAQDIRKLLTYAEDTAGGLMTTEIIKVHFSLNKKQAVDEVITQSEEIGEFYDIYVVDDKERLIGTVSLKDLIKAKPATRIGDIMNGDVVYVDAHTDQEEAAQLISQYNLTGIPVVDRNMQLLGRVTFDDAMDVLEEETTEDILKISGVSDDEELSGTWKAAVRSRLPWLMINLVTASLAGFVVFLFQPTISKLTLLTVFMPIIAGMGGNAGTQALAVTIRRISLNTLPDAKILGAISKELLVGLFNGLCMGIIASVVAIITEQSTILGLVVFLAMTGNLLIAGIAGSSIPILLEKIGFDPAVASSIFITAFTDIIGFLLLLGLGTYFLI